MAPYFVSVLTMMGKDLGFSLRVPSLQFVRKSQRSLLTDCDSYLWLCPVFAQDIWVSRCIGSGTCDSCVSSSSVAGRSTTGLSTGCSCAIHSPVRPVIASATSHSYRPSHDCTICTPLTCCQMQVPLTFPSMEVPSAGLCHARFLVTRDSAGTLPTVPSKTKQCLTDSSVH